MRRTPLLLAALVLFATFLPAPVLAAPCSETVPRVSFNANPRTDVAVGSETRFSFRFNWSTACEGGTILRWEVHDIYRSTDFLVRSSPGAGYDMATAGFRGTGERNWDFNATWITSSGPHLFNARVFLDGRQITATTPVTVSAAGEGAPTSGPAPSGGDAGPVQAGPVALEVTIGDYASAVNIPSYVAALYRYGLGVGVTLAMVMVVIGGFQYMTARGNPSAIGAARGRITNAILGLLLLLGSFTLLQTINPELVTMRNIIVPEIQRVETISNKCEDFNREQFTVTPTTGRCGETGTVARRDNTQLATNTCNWGVCGADGEVCVVRGTAGPACVKCGDVSDDELGRWGLSESNAACARFSFPGRGTEYGECIYSQDNAFGQEILHIDDVCAHVSFDCNEVSRCGEYDAAVKAYHQGVSVDVERMAIDALIATSRERLDNTFERICNADPCGRGPCHAVAVSPAALWQWNCMQGTGSGGGESAPPRPVETFEDIETAPRAGGRR